MAFSTLNSIQRGLTIINNIYKYIFAVDASLVLFYPFDTKNTSNNTPNYASTLPVYDGSFCGNSQITTTTNTYITSIADLSLNNTAGQTATDFIVTKNTFTLEPSTGLSISCWFSCSGQLNANQTLFSLPLTSSSGNGINISVSGMNNILSAYYTNVIPNIYYTLTTDFNNTGTDTTATVNTNTSVINLTINTIPCAYFNGTTSNLKINFANYTNTTFGCWIYYSGSSTNTNSPISIGNNTSNNTCVRIDLYNLIYIYLFAGLSEYNSIYSTVAIAGTITTYLNTWVHITFTYSQQSPFTCNIYLNGSRSITTNGTGIFTNTPNIINLGTTLDSPRFTGYMRNFFVYNSVLSDSQVMNMYTSTKFF